MRNARALSPIPVVTDTRLPMLGLAMIIGLLVQLLLGVWTDEAAAPGPLVVGHVGLGAALLLLGMVITARAAVAHERTWLWSAAGGTAALVLAFGGGALAVATTAGAAASLLMTAGCALGLFAFAWALYATRGW